MKTKYENKLSMYLAVQLLCQNNPTITAAIPQFDTLLAQFADTILLIDVNRMKQETDIKGFAQDKYNKRKDVALQAASICNKVVAFAALTGDTNLEQRINFTKYDWNDSPDTQFVEKATLVHTETTALISVLATYNVTQPMLDNLIAAIIAYSGVLSDPRNAIVERKTATATITQLFRQADALLYDKMDKLVEVVAQSEPTFYSNYHNARIIVDSGHREISIEGKILDAATTVPITGAKVELLEHDKHIITRSTGGYRFSSLPGGNYTLKISIQRYKTQIIQNVPVIEGKMYVRNVMLERGDEHYTILPSTDIIAWHGTPDSNLLITVTNKSTVPCDLWTYITQNPTDPIPADKITLHQNQHHQFRLSDYQPAETIYLHLKNPDTLNTATYQLAFANELQP